MTPTLEQRLWTTLVRMQLLSNGKTARIDANRVNGSKDTGVFPAGEHDCEFIAYQQRFNRANNYGSKLEIVEEAEADLKRWQKATPPTEPKKGTYWFKVMIGTSALTPTELARLYDVSRVTVYEYKRRYGTEQAA